MTERFVFRHNPSIQNVGQALATERGQEAVFRMAAEFISVVDLLHHSQSVGNGSSTLVHMPDGDNLAFVNVPKQEFAQAAHLVADYYGFNQG